MSEIFDLGLYRARLAALAARGVFIGTSSWNYEGWIGQIYRRSGYDSKGKFAKTRFERDALSEYAETFKTVCFDGAYYEFKPEEKLAAMAAQVPADFKFAFKVADQITISRYPNVARHGRLAGTTNEQFLSATLFVERFLKPVESAIGSKLGPIIFEFSKFYSTDCKSGSEFVADLDRFFGELLKDRPYSVELRNRTWLGFEYLACLKKHGVSYAYNSWTDMPAVSEQIELVGDQATEARSVSRFLLKPGRKYEEAVKSFNPYEKFREVQEDARGAVYLGVYSWRANIPNEIACDSGNPREIRYHDGRAAMMSFGLGSLRTSARCWYSISADPTKSARCAAMPRSQSC